MPDLIRHPEGFEVAGFPLSQEWDCKTKEPYFFGFLPAFFTPSRFLTFLCTSPLHSP
jgi:hypothetical protein